MLKRLMLIVLVFVVLGLFGCDNPTPTDKVDLQKAKQHAEELWSQHIQALYPSSEWEVKGKIVVFLGNYWNEGMVYQAEAIIFNKKTKETVHLVNYRCSLQNEGCRKEPDVIKT